MFSIGLWSSHTTPAFNFIETLWSILYKIIHSYIPAIESLPGRKLFLPPLGIDCCLLVINRRLSVYSVYGLSYAHSVLSAHLIFQDATTVNDCCSDLLLIFSSFKRYSKLATVCHNCHYSDRFPHLHYQG